MEILELAIKFEVTRLKFACEKIILKLFDESNAFDVFTFSDRNNLIELKISTFKRIQDLLGAELDDELLKKPSDLRDLIEAKCKFDALLEKNLKKS